MEKAILFLNRLTRPKNCVCVDSDAGESLSCCKDATGPDFLLAFPCWQAAKVIGKKKGTGEEETMLDGLAHFDKKESFSKGVDSSTLMLDPDLNVSCDVSTPCESERGYAAHAKTKCADSVRLQYAGFRDESFFAKEFVSEAVHQPQTLQENRFH